MIVLTCLSLLGMPLLSHLEMKKTLKVQKLKSCVLLSVVFVSTNFGFSKFLNFSEIQSELKEYDAEGIRLTLHIAVGAGDLYTFHLV